MPTIFHIIFYPFFHNSCYRWVLIVTSKWHVLSTSRCHILGSPEQKILTCQCPERPSSSELNLYSSCPLLYFTTGGIVALLWSSGISLKCFCKVGRVQTGNRENSNYKFQFLFFFLEKCDRQTDGHNNVWLGLSRVLLRNNKNKNRKKKKKWRPYY